MRNTLAIQILATALCFTMLAEIPIMAFGDEITIEVDTEKEQEESSETEKEKTTGHQYDLNEHEGLAAKLKYAAVNQDSNWKSPSIDLHTPPPEQA